MKRYLIFFVCAVIANAQLINDLSTEWRSTGQSYGYKNQEGFRVNDFNKSFKSTVLNNNFSYRNNYIDLTGNVKWQADGSVPAAIRENLNTYRFYALTHPEAFYNFTLSGGVEKQEAADIGWVSDFETKYENNDQDTIYIPQTYQTIERPDYNLSWLGAGYNFQSGALTVVPQINYFMKQEKGNLTVLPISDIDSVSVSKIDREDYDWQLKVLSGWKFNDNHTLQVKGYYHDDLADNSYYNVYSAEGGLNSELSMNDFQVQTYFGSGLLHYQDNDRAFGRSNIVVSYKTHPNLNLKLKNSFSLYEDETNSEKISITTGWRFNQAGYDHNELSLYGSFNSKGVYKFARIGLGGRYWIKSWLNQADVNLKTSKISRLVSYTIRSQYYWNKLNSIYANAELDSYQENTFQLDQNDLRVTVGIQSGLY